MFRSGKPIGFWSAVLLGMGAMVGAGIFALLGQAGSIAGSGVWLSFVYGGIVAALSGYSLGRLGARYPSAGGLVEYLAQAYGGGYLAGSGAFLLYLSGLLALTLIAKAFGSYACALLLGHTTPWLVNAFAVGVVALFAVINLKGAAEVAVVENVVVGIKVVVLCLFIVIGGSYIDPDRLAVSHYPPQISIAASIGVTFFAFEGFRVITNAAEDMPNPQRQLPRAIMTAIAAVAVLYVLLSVVVFGNLDAEEAVRAKDYALAQAAAPAFGATGFIIISVAALVSTASAINANLYAVTNVTYQMAKDGELPAAFGRPIGHSREGLLISASLVAALALLLDLSALAVIGSLTILIVHVTVHVGHWRLLGETRAARPLVAAAIVANIAVISLVTHYEMADSPTTLLYLLAFVLAAAILEGAFRWFRGRGMTVRTAIESPAILTKTPGTGTETTRLRKP